MVRCKIIKATQFPLEIYRIESQGAMELHTHNVTELVLVLSGRGTHVTPDEEYRISHGDVFVIQGGEVHGYRDTHQLSIVNVLFDIKKLGLPRADLGHIVGNHVLLDIEPHLRRDHPARERMRLSTGDIGLASSLVDQIDEELIDSIAGFRFMATALFMQLLGFLSRCCSDIHPSKDQSMLRIGRALSYLDHHFAESINTQILTKFTHMSPSSFRRAFQKAVGTSPMKYLIHLRLRKGAEMLRDGDVRITTVAHRVGFSDGNYFSRQFHRVMGLTPREYKRAVNNDN